ncbi:MAG: hypothetical protein H8E39_01925 [Alphaproteobacteria bacterium]|nr:hypothetical protein [Alphaproteobacteria bacterium]
MSNSPLTYTKRFIIDHPICCFCGGGTPATTRDHVPAKVIFDGKHRPKGLEVPACVQCQEYSKKHELVAAMVARFFPDSTTSLQGKEIKKLFRRADKAVPGLLDEMKPSLKQKSRISEFQKKEPNAAHVLNLGGPLVNASLDIFAIKMTCALHYGMTKNIIPIDGAISIRVFSNVDALNGEIPHALINVLGSENTLKQGTWSVSNQFSYSYAITDTKAYGVYFSTFRRSFAVLGLVWDNINIVPIGEGMKTFTPHTTGEFRRIR